MTVDELLEDITSQVEVQQSVFATFDYMAAYEREEALRDAYETAVTYLLEYIDDGRVMSEFNRLELP